MAVQFVSRHPLFTRYITLGFLLAFSACHQNSNTRQSAEVTPEPIQNTATPTPVPVPVTVVQPVSGVTADPTPSPRIKSVPVASMQAAREGTLTCTSASECHASVVMVSIPTAEGVTRCTGILTAPNEVLTSDHCLKDLEGDDCSDFVFVHFAATPDGLPAQSVACARIKKRSHATSLQNVDDAIMVLKAPVEKRVPLKLSALGFSDRDRAVLYQVKNGTLAKSECQAVYSSFLYPSIQASSSPLMSFADCALQSEGAGAPLLNAKGEVGAVAQGVLSLPDGSVQATEIKKVQLDPVFGSLALATQAICVNGTCKTVPAQALEAIDQYLVDHDPYAPPALPESEALDNWQEVLPPGDTVKYYVKAPDCVAAGTKAKTEIPANEIEYREGINHSYVTEWRMAGSRPISMKVAEEVASDDTEAELVHPVSGSIFVSVCASASAR